MNGRKNNSGYPYRDMLFRKQSCHDLLYSTSEINLLSDRRNNRHHQKIHQKQLGTRDHHQLFRQ